VIYEQLRTALLRTALAFAVWGCAQSSAIAQASSDSKACKQLPTTEVEAALGTAIERKLGNDLPNFSSCTVFAGATASAKVEIHAAGQAGLPKDVASGLAGVKEMLGSRMQGFETDSAGDVGCYRGTLTIKGAGSAYATTCFKPTGYVTVTVTRGDMLPTFAAVKAVLAKIGAGAH
jgi:hypothetical protein